MKTPHTLFAAALVLAAATLGVARHGATAPPPHPETVRYTDIGGRVQILGRFGLPLGQFLTLRGRRHGRARVATKMGAGNFQVEQINGRAVAQPFTVWVNGVTALPASTPCVVTGYETGAMIGEPQDIARRTGAAPQAAWQFAPRLVVLSVRVGAP